VSSLGCVAINTAAALSRAASSVERVASNSIDSCHHSECTCPVAHTRHYLVCVQLARDALQRRAQIAQCGCAVDDARELVDASHAQRCRQCALIGTRIALLPRARYVRTTHMR
jgi:hypothetical protein